ncbi:MAG: DUF447 family protein [Candidatus Lokiarchaeota archaeon]|nr:DUF447 family protein [Candidatus Lokiarchaeota archaeon]
MSPIFQIDFTSLGLKNNYLYEILATTFSFDKNLMVPNTASMGVRLVDEKTLKIWPYPNTTTYKNIENSKFVILNFVDDVYLYAVASLKGSNLSKNNRALSKENYSYYTLNINGEYRDFANSITAGISAQIPYLKQAWAIIACVARSKNQILKIDGYGKTELMEIDLSVIGYEKFRESFKLYNRAENVTLETIVLTSKLNFAIEKKDEALIKTLKGKIEENVSDVKRFGKNLSALKAIEHIESYIKGLES